MRVLGIDEAGRGCVLGDLVVGGFCAAVDDRAALKDAGAADSKRLSAKKRLAAREALSPLGDWHVERVSARQIDAGNLNTLEERAIVSLIRRFRPDRVEIDAPTHPGGIPRLIARLQGALEADGLTPEWLVEPKADHNWPHVGAASIFAKTTRDGLLAELDATHGPLGSGYPSDPVTRAWLSACLRRDEPLPAFVRSRWGTLDRLRQEQLF